MVHTATNHDRRWAVFSPEMQPWEQFAAECAEVFKRKPFWPKGGVAGMTDAEVLDAERWLCDRVTMLVCDAEDEAPTIEWILERARATVLRDGVTDLLIDPWNEIDQQRKSGETETDYVARTLQRLKAFALRHGCNVWIIVHPAKPVLLKSGEKRAAPGPYDISGSAHWANKTDLGITIHSPNSGTSEVHLWKPRFRRWGKRGAVALLDFDEITGCYQSQRIAAPDGLPRSWHDVYQDA
jgi:twinkle protein